MKNILFVLIICLLTTQIAIRLLNNRLTVYTAQVPPEINEALEYLENIFAVFVPYSVVCEGNRRNVMDNVAKRTIPYIHTVQVELYLNESVIDSKYIASNNLYYAVLYNSIDDANKVLDSLNGYIEGVFTVDMNLKDLFVLSEKIRLENITVDNCC